MTIQELVGKAQKAIRDAEEAIQALNEIVEAINLDANGFKVIELTVDAAYQILLACDDDPEALTMKYMVWRRHARGNARRRGGQ